ncbi:hypothetical protein [Roseburia sp. 499]|nr:hypothetical protein [Roseburia sp. 499]WVK69442.1 hypothetical protein BIV20_13930 [Roseburia sp. 499]
MKKKSFIQWFICLIRRDMEEYEEDIGAKKSIYNVVQQETLNKKKKRWR